jgi:hypothetical protein
MKYKIIKIVVAGALIFNTSACNKWLDVNNNPNIAKDANLELLLPSAEVGISSVLGSSEFLVNGGFWAQYWTQSPSSSQFKMYDQFQTNTDDYNTSWSYAYAYALQDLAKISNKAIAENKTQYAAIAKLLSAYMYQVVTDAWGDVPFKNALKGAQGTSPSYDNQQAIYSGIVTLINEADALIDENSPTHPTTDDVIFGGDMSTWRKFGNSLKLKVAMRISQVDPTTSQEIVTSLNAANAEYLDTDVKVNYSSAGGNQNPYFSFCVGVGRTQNIYGSNTCMSQMNLRQDPRIAVFYNESNNGTFNGIPQGEYDNNDPVFLDGVCNPSAFVGADPTNDASATAPVILMSLAESNFLQAEAAARGWTTAIAKDLYEAGIIASMNYCGLISAAADYIALPINAYPSSETDAIKAIITQKYFSMCGTQGFEAWTEWRRTGYPDFFVTPKYSAIGSSFPARYLYPSNEVTLNANYPGTKSITNKMWWDIN